MENSYYSNQKFVSKTSCRISQRKCRQAIFLSLSTLCIFALILNGWALFGKGSNSFSDECSDGDFMELVSSDDSYIQEYFKVKNLYADSRGLFVTPCNPSDWGPPSDFHVHTRSQSSIKFSSINLPGNWFYILLDNPVSMLGWFGLVLGLFQIPAHLLPRSEQGKLSKCIVQANFEVPGALTQILELACSDIHVYPNLNVGSSNQRYSEVLFMNSSIIIKKVLQETQSPTGNIKRLLVNLKSQLLNSRSFRRSNLQKSAIFVCEDIGSIEALHKLHQTVKSFGFTAEIANLAEWKSATAISQIMTADLVIDFLPPNYLEKAFVPFFLSENATYIEVVPHRWQGSLNPTLQRLVVSPWLVAHGYRSMNGSMVLHPTVLGKTINLANLISHGKLSGTSTAADFSDERFLLFLPWEQLNNQIIGMKCACATAVALNRRLVLPSLGYRHAGASQNNGFVVKDFSWYPITRYYEEAGLLGLPCQPITMQNFRYVSSYLASGNSSIDLAIVNPLTKSEDKKQLLQYFEDVEGLHVRETFVGKRSYQLSKRELIERYGKLKHPVIAFGSLFWTYKFGERMKYPLEEYYDFMKQDLYRKITSQMVYNAELKQMIEDRIPKVLGTSYVAIHLRRGDYRAKCNELPGKLQSKCWPSDEQILKYLKQMGLLDANLNLFIATNSDQMKELLVFRKHFKAIFIGRDIFTPSHEVWPFLQALDKEHIPAFDDNFEIEKSIADVIVCSNAKHFIGNLYSSFSRTIVEIRQQNKLNYSFYP